jgi:hypothetical protein
MASTASTGDLAMGVNHSEIELGQRCLCSAALRYHWAPGIVQTGSRPLEYLRPNPIALPHPGRPARAWISDRAFRRVGTASVKGIHAQQRRGLAAEHKQVFAFRGPRVDFNAKDNNCVRAQAGVRWPLRFRQLVIRGMVDLQLNVFSAMI